MQKKAEKLDIVAEWETEKRGNGNAEKLTLTVIR